MLYMLCIQLHPGTKDQVIEKFELRGPNRSPGVTYRGAWIGAHDDSVFVLVESAEQSLIDQAIASWGDFGTFEIHPVNDVENY